MIGSFRGASPLSTQTSPFEKGGLRGIYVALQQELETAF